MSTGRGHNGQVPGNDRLRIDGIQVPLERRLHEGQAHFEAVMNRHREAVAKSKPAYRDPVSGYSVFTAAFLAQRGYCCASGCRHCPYEQ